MGYLDPSGVLFDSAPYACMHWSIRSYGSLKSRIAGITNCDNHIYASKMVISVPTPLSICMYTLQDISALDKLAKCQSS